MRAALVVVACTVACSFRPPPNGLGGGSGSDARPPGDAPRDGGADAKQFRDAALDATTCEPATCGAAGGRCSAGACDIAPGNSTTVGCPAMETCVVSCPSDNSTCDSDTLTCASGATCAFHCDADHTCDSASLTCATGSRCEIYCKGNHACDSFGITCSLGATCIYHCCGGSSCSSFGCSGAGCMNGGSGNCP